MDPSPRFPGQTIQTRTRAYVSSSASAPSSAAAAVSAAVSSGAPAVSGAGEPEHAVASPAGFPDPHSEKDGGLAGTLTREYGLSADRVTQEALREDLAQYGEDRLRDALREACLANSRERVSVRFWRAILSGPREKKPAAFDYMTRPEAHRNDPDYWSALEVNLDEDGL